MGAANQTDLMIRPLLYSVARKTIPLVARSRNSLCADSSSVAHSKPPGCGPRALNSSLKHRYEGGVKCAQEMVHLRAVAYAWNSAVKYDVPTLGLSGGGGLKTMDN